MGKDHLKWGIIGLGHMVHEFAAGICKIGPVYAVASRKYTMIKITGESGNKRYRIPLT
ncbi:hypothetical protein FACS189468_9150 [Spirochaetia bacterium]|nr:hypothetical protein FACS189468_9150 [Spirochaetia bacterium]